MVKAAEPKNSAIRAATKPKMVKMSAANKLKKAPRIKQFLAKEEKLAADLRAHVPVGEKKSNFVVNGRLKCLYEGCDRTFNYSVSRRLHIRRVHTKEKPFKCDRCNRRFTGTGDLKLHMETIHLGIKYKCPLCPATLATKKSLRRHTKTLHDESSKTWVCQLCGEKFATAALLETHIKKHKRDHALKAVQLEKALQDVDDLRTNAEEIIKTREVELKLATKKLNLEKKKMSHLLTWLQSGPILHAMHLKKMDKILTKASSASEISLQALSVQLNAQLEKQAALKKEKKAKKDAAKKEKAENASSGKKAEKVLAAATV